jgi:hypothetical protein
LIGFREGGMGNIVSSISHPAAVEIILLDAPLLLLTRFTDSLFHGVCHVDGLNDDLPDGAIAVDEEALEVAID